MRIAYSDLEQAESRVVGAILYRLFGDSAYLTVQESGDPHTLVCSMCWSSLPFPQDFNLQTLLNSSEKKFPKDLLLSAKAVANSIAYRKMTYRDLAKRLSHGSNYMGQPFQMAKAVHTSKKIVEHFQDEYFGAFPFLQRWHEWVATTLMTKRQITTLLGRRRIFFDRPDDSSTLREAVAFEPQSVATGDYMNIGMTLLWKKNLPLLLNKQIHDALAYTFDERDEQWLLPEVQKILSWPILLTPHKEQLSSLQNSKRLSTFASGCLARLQSLPQREFSIPVETAVGWNLGYFNEKTNPNGLKKFSPSCPDSRKRIPTKPLSPEELFFRPSFSSAA